MGPELHRAGDPPRDQSWFLFATTAAQLGFTRFPLGDMPDKAAVRAEAARLGLPVAAKPDSQDICFVADRAAMPTWSAVSARTRASPATSSTGTGACSAGTRASPTTPSARARARAAASSRGSRQVVVALDAPRRRIVVGPREAGGASVRLRDVNWLVRSRRAWRCEVKLRAREAPHPATVDATTG